MSEEMVDRVAFAIRESYGCEDGADGFRACIVDHCSCRAVARQAIAAMREPTEAMLDTGARAINNGLVLSLSSQRAQIVWNDMIDAALAK